MVFAKVRMVDRILRFMPRFAHRTFVGGVAYRLVMGIRERHTSDDAHSAYEVCREPVVGVLQTEHQQGY